MNKIILVFSILLSTCTVNAQDLSMDYFSYLYNWYNINPAFCSKDDKMAAILNVRQRAGVNFNNSMIGVKGLSNENQGFGVRIISDNRGAFQVMKIDATYGYKITLSEKSSLHFGLSAGIVNRTFNVAKIKNYETLDPTDPVLQASNLKSNSFIAGTGIVYDYKSFEFSASSPSLLESGQPTSKNFLLMANNKFNVSKDVHLTPILFYFNMPVVKNYGGIQLRGDYRNMVWTQFGYQTNQVYNAGVGCVLGVLSVGYNYSTSNTIMANQSSGTHEVLLKLKISSKGNAGPVAAENNASTVIPTDSKVNAASNSDVVNQKLSSIIQRLDKMTGSNNIDKAAVKAELESLKKELSDLLKNSQSSNGQEIGANLDTIERKIKELELKLEK